MLVLLSAVSVVLNVVLLFGHFGRFGPDVLRFSDFHQQHPRDRTDEPHTVQRFLSSAGRSLRRHAGDMMGGAGVHNIYRMPPISSLATTPVPVPQPGTRATPPDQENPSGGAGTSSIFVNMHWDVGDGNGRLRLPRARNPALNGAPYKLMVDVGLERGSYLMCMLFGDPSLVLMGVEANPGSFHASLRNMLALEMDSRMSTRDLIAESVRKRTLLLPLALADAASGAPGSAKLNLNYADACGSILQSKEGGWWCTHTVGHTFVPLATLSDVLSLLVPLPEALEAVPGATPTGRPRDEATVAAAGAYEFYFLKVDVEGADHLVLQGAGAYLWLFSMVTVECRPKGAEAGDKSRDGTCDRERLVQQMAPQPRSVSQTSDAFAPGPVLGFAHHFCDLEDCHFARSEDMLTEIKRMFLCTHNAKCEPMRSSFGSYDQCPYYDAAGGAANAKDQSPERVRERVAEAARVATVPPNPLYTTEAFSSVV